MEETVDTALFPIIDGKYKLEETPTIRVGVILEEDKRSSVELVLPATGFDLVVDGDCCKEISDEATVKIALVDGQLKIEMSGNSGKLPEGEIIHFIPKIEDPELKPCLGIKVRNIVAGRGFHWAQEIDQYLPGMVEVRVSNNQNSILLINDLSVEHYLIGVITSEMSAACPIDYMKAQAIAARSWLLAQPISPYPDEPFDVCNDDQCQRYQGSEGWTEEAIKVIQECHGETLITEGNKYCDARYSKSTGGISEDAMNVWHEDIAGLDAMIDAPEDDPIHQFFPVTQENIWEYITGDWLKETKAFASPTVVNEETITKYLGRVDLAGEYFRWKIDLSQNDLLKALSSRGGIPEIYDVVDLIARERGRSGRIKNLEVVYRKAPDKNKRSHFLESEYDIRAGLWTRFLYSSCFVMEKHFDDEEHFTGVTLHGGGWGHGAGLCQIGGLGRALSGQKYEEILMAYFSKVRLEKIY